MPRSTDCSVGVDDDNVDRCSICDSELIIRAEDLKIHVFHYILFF